MLSFNVYFKRFAFLDDFQAFQVNYHSDQNQTNLRHY
jgi:hypothetical protein